MAPSPFFTLPAELRNRIYEDVLVRREPILVGPVHESATQDEIFDLSEGLQQKSLPALLAVCHQTRQECLEMFYAGNEFSFRDLNAEAEMAKFMRAIGLQGCRALREVSVVGQVDREGYLITHTLSRPHATDDERKGMIRRESVWMVRIQCTQETRFRCSGEFLQFESCRHDLKGSLERLDSLVMEKWTRGIGYVIRESMEAVTECLEDISREEACRLLPNGLVGAV